MVSVTELRFQDLIAVFDQTFYSEFNTRLVKGDDEPFYAPAGEGCAYHQVIFAHGYFASALHEIAHWCIAGAARRMLPDYGYWYCPDGRDAQQQAEFEQVEVKPQALEWFFSLAAGAPFRVSTDNLNGVEADRFGFQTAVYQQVQQYLQQGLPARAAQFVAALQRFYQTPTLTLSDFAWEGSNMALENVRPALLEAEHG